MIRCKSIIYLGAATSMENTWWYLTVSAAREGASGIVAFLPEYSKEPQLRTIHSPAYVPVDIAQLYFRLPTTR